MKKLHIARTPSELAFLAEIAFSDVKDLIAAGAADSSLLRDSAFWDALATTLGSHELFAPACICSETALQLNPQDQAARLNMAVNLDSLGKAEEALHLLAEVPEETPRRQVIVANILFAQKRYLEAIPLFEQAIECEPDFFLAYCNLLDCLEQTGNPLFDFWLDKAVRAVPTSARLAQTYCTHLLATNRYDELARADWIDAITIQASSEGVIGHAHDELALIVQVQLLRRAAVAIVDRDHDTLEDAIVTLASASPDWGLCEPARLLALTAADVGRADLVPDAFGRICENCRTASLGVPSSLAGLLGCAHRRAGDIPNALLCCKEALEEAPNCVFTLGEYWWCLDEAERSAEAIPIAEHLYSLNPNELHMAYNLGYLCGKIGALGKSKHYYKEQIERSPKHAMAWENLSLLHVMESDLPKAESTFSEYIRCAHDPEYLCLSSQVEGSPSGGKDSTGLSDKIQQKVRKFASLLEFAREISGSSTFALNIVEFNQASLPWIGAETTITSREYHNADVLKCLSSPEELTSKDISFQLEMSQRRDNSIQFQALLEVVPHLRSLPEAAQWSLVEGERRVNDVVVTDFSPSVVAYAKAVEICLKEHVFDEYRKACEAQDGIDRKIEAASSDEHEKAHRFAEFISKGRHLELGGMVFSLRLCRGRTARRLALLGEFADFIGSYLGLRALLEVVTLDKIEELARDFRNPAAHAAILRQDQAIQARTLTLQVLQIFGGGKI